MAAADSKAVVIARLGEMGLADLQPKFEEFGWCSFSDFAYSYTDFKGTDPAIFEAEVVDKLLTSDKSRAPRVRRLFMQSYATAAAELERCANPAEAKATAMHPVDRDRNLQEVKDQITSFSVTLENAPSHALVNFFNAFLQTGIITYPKWEKATSRKQEIQQEVVVPGMTLTAEGVFEPVPAKLPDANLSTELRWDGAMRRRGIGQAVPKLCSFKTHALWVEVLREAYLSEVEPGYRKVTWTQLRNADRRLYEFVATECEAGCTALGGETVTRFEKAFLRGIFAPEVRHFLYPLSDGTASTGSRSSSELPIVLPPQQSAGGGQGRELEKLKNRLAQAEQALTALRGQKRKQEQGKGSGRGSGKGKRLRQNLWQGRTG